MFEGTEGRVCNLDLQGSNCAGLEHESCSDIRSAGMVNEWPLIDHGCYGCYGCHGCYGQSTDVAVTERCFILIPVEGPL